MVKFKTGVWGKKMWQMDTDDWLIFAAAVIGVCVFYAMAILFLI